MKHTIGLEDDYVIRQSPIHDGYGTRIVNVTGYTTHDFGKNVSDHFIRNPAALPKPEEVFHRIPLGVR
jgi:hypothetical protein